MYTSLLFEPIPRARRMAWTLNPFGGVTIMRGFSQSFSYNRDQLTQRGYSFDDASDLSWSHILPNLYRQMGLNSNTTNRSVFAEISGRLAYIQGWARVMLARLARRRKIEREFAPGGPGYLRARENFQILAGQRRKTRRFKPY